MKFKNKFKLQVVRDGKIVAEHEGFNLVTTQGKNHMLDATLDAATQVTTWYLGLIDNSPSPTLAAADTAASHAGWTELEDYDEANRVTWTPNAASNGQTQPSASSDFTINATCTVYGFFLISNNTKGGSTGTLFAEAAFPLALACVDNDVIKITHTVTLNG